MYFFYVDESGTKDPRIFGERKDGTTFEKDWPYILFAVSLFKWHWDKFEREISDRKMKLIHRVSADTGDRFDLADAEVHSTVLRNAKNRMESRFFRHLHPHEIGFVTEAYYNSIQAHNMNCFAVIVDKKELPKHYTQEMLHTRTYELLLERIEQFLQNYHPKQRGLIIMDNSDKNLNRRLTMKHSWLLKNGSSSVRFKHIVEMPLFVESSLSHGVQLADLCAYNCFHAIKYNKPDYPYFQKMLPSFYNSPKTRPEKFDGIKVFPESVRVSETIKSAIELSKKTVELSLDGL
ncbi:MAG: DUF3800 domain-containing protein [Nitrospirae bacterium]|nr:DUF3800 domain-containing protein [Nitrospirota bacterium]